MCRRVLDRACAIAFSADEPPPSRACLGYLPPAPPRLPGVACLVPKALAPALSPDHANCEKCSRPRSNTPSREPAPPLSSSIPPTHRYRIFFKKIFKFSYSRRTVSSIPFPTQLLTVTDCCKTYRSLDLRIFFFVIGYFFTSAVSVVLLKLTHSPTSRGCAVPSSPPLSLYNIACRRTARSTYTTLHVAAAPLYDKNIDRRPDGSLARLPRPFAPTALASCAQLKCASMPRRRDPRTCLSVERFRRRHTWMVCCASFRPPDCCLRPPINSGRASLYPAVPYNATRLCTQCVL